MFFSDNLILMLERLALVPARRHVSGARVTSPSLLSPIYHAVHITSDIDWLESFPVTVPDARYLRAKRAMDLLFVLTALPLLIFIMLLCALLIKLESPDGPVLFLQERTGKDGRRFQMYKFRTMVPDAEQRKYELLALNELQWPDFKIANDPRVTMVGRFLRKTSLDELPQILNVLRGDMSLVGPRPTSFRADTYDLWQTERLEAIPGLTGLWQIVGRGSMEFSERSHLDIAYIERRCLYLDFLILLFTITAVLKQRGTH